MDSTTIDFQGYKVVVESTKVDDNTRSYTIAFEGEIIGSGIAEAASHAEVIDYFDIAPIMAMIYNRQSFRA